MPELQHEVIVADHAMRREPPVHLGEVDRPLPLMDLHGIPPAQRDVRSTLAFEMNEVSLAAGAASGARLRGGNLGVFVCPNIEGKQSSPHAGSFGANQQLQRFGRSDRRHEIHR
jgi:hypothetical protein